MSLALPPPINGHQHPPTMSPATPAPADKPSAALLANIIYPSREIRSIIDKTAIHIAKSPLPQQLEDKIREHQKSDPKFSFLRDSDPFHRYYRYMIERVKEDGEQAVLAGAQAGATTTAAAATVAPVNGGEGEENRDQVTREREEMRAREQKKALERLKEPEAWEWALDLPNVTAKDL